MRSKVQSMKFVFWICFIGGIGEFFIPNLQGLILNQTISDYVFLQSIVFMTLLWSIPGIIAFKNMIDKMEDKVENKTA